MEGGPEGGSSAAAMGNEFKVAHENLLKIEADERAEKVNKAGTETAEQAEFKQFNRNFKSEGPLFPKTEQQPPQEKKGIFSRFFRREAVNTIDQNSVDYVANKYGLTDEEKNNLNSLPPEERAAYGSLREAARLRERIAMDKENMQQKAKNQRIESITNQDPRYVTKEAKAAKRVDDRRDQGYQAVAKEMDAYLNETSSAEAEPTDADLAQIETDTNKIAEDSSAPAEELGVVGAESEAAGDEGVDTTADNQVEDLLAQRIMEERNSQPSVTEPTLSTSRVESPATQSSADGMDDLLAQRIYEQMKIDDARAARLERNTGTNRVENQYPDRIVETREYPQGGKSEFHFEIADSAKEDDRELILIEGRPHSIVRSIFEIHTKPDNTTELSRFVKDSDGQWYMTTSTGERKRNRNGTFEDEMKPFVSVTDELLTKRFDSNIDNILTKKKQQSQQAA